MRAAGLLSRCVGARVPRLLLDSAPRSRPAPLSVRRLLDQASSSSPGPRRRPRQPSPAPSHSVATAAAAPAPMALCNGDSKVSLSPGGSMPHRFRGQASLRGRGTTARPPLPPAPQRSPAARAAARRRVPGRGLWHVFSSGAAGALLILSACRGSCGRRSPGVGEGVSSARPCRWPPPPPRRSSGSAAGGWR